MIRIEIQDNFSSHLRSKLRERFRGRLPSAVVFAAQFNRRISEYASTISQETARRWLRGISFPEESRLRVLAEWLDLDLRKAFALSPVDDLLDRWDPDSGEFLRLFSLLETSKKKVFLDLLRISAEA